MKLLYKIIIPISVVLVLLMGLVFVVLYRTVATLYYQQSFLTAQRDAVRESIEHLQVGAPAHPQTAEEAWQGFVDGVKSSQVGRVTIWNKEGTILFSDLQSIVGQSYPEHPEVKRALSQGEVFYLVKEEGGEIVKQSSFGPFLDVYIPIEIAAGFSQPERVAVEMQLPIAALKSPFNKMFFQFLLALAGAIAAILFIVYLVVTYVLITPINRLSLGMAEMRKGNLRYQTKRQVNDEIGRLEGEFVTMSQELSLHVARIEEQKQNAIAAEQKIQQKIKDIRGRDNALANILEDVTESERELRQRTDELKKFKEAVDTSFDHVVITDPNARVLYVNHGAEAITGYTKEEMIGQTPALWGKQMPPEFYKTFWQTVKGEKTRYAGEITNRRKDGRKYLASLRVTPILDEQGEVKYFVGIERDITEERKYQTKLLRHATKLEQANLEIRAEKERTEGILRFLQSIGEAVYAVDVNRKIIFINKKAAEFIGKSPMEIVGTHTTEHFVFESGQADAIEHQYPIREVLKRKEDIEFPHHTFIVKGEKRLPVAGAASPIFDEDRQLLGAIVIFQDISEKYELEQMKDNFLSVAAHQLRTPLGSMRWNMELLLGGDLGRLSKNAREAIQQIYDNSQRMIILVNDLLNVSRIDQNRGREDRQVIDVATIVTEAVKTMQPESDRRQVRLSVVRQGRKSPLKALLPPKHFHEAVENLVSNAIKYNRSHGTVTVTLMKKDEKIRIEITDTGIGIPKADQPKIFSKFFRAVNAVRKETEGSGLGLSVVKSYVEEAGGRIMFSSEENVGTTFVIEIPAAVD